MKEMLDYNLRAGKHINIVEELDELEAKFRADLKGTIDAYDSLDEVSSETMNDLIVFNTVIRMMEKFGYLDDEETVKICRQGASIRQDYLEKLEGGVAIE